MLSDARIEKLTRHGIALMQEERELALKGDLAALGELNQRKVAFLEQIEELAAQSQKVGSHEMRTTRKNELTTLFDIMRRRAEENQLLLRAAEAGVKGARAKIDRIEAGAQAVGAYDERGQQIAQNKAAKQSFTY